MFRKKSNSNTTRLYLYLVSFESCASQEMFKTVLDKVAEISNLIRAQSTDKTVSKIGVWFFVLRGQSTFFFSREEPLRIPAPAATAPNPYDKVGLDSASMVAESGPGYGLRAQLRALTIREARYRTPSAKMQARCRTPSSFSSVGLSRLFANVLNRLPAPGFS